METLEGTNWILLVGAGPVTDGLRMHEIEIWTADRWLDILAGHSGQKVIDRKQKQHLHSMWPGVPVFGFGELAMKRKLGPVMEGSR